MEESSPSSLLQEWWTLITLPLLAQQGVCAWLSCILWLLLAVMLASVLSWWLTPGGNAWGSRRRRSSSSKNIPGPRGWPLLGSLLEMSSGQAHRKLAKMAEQHRAKELMALSLGQTRVVISSSPGVARELLNSTAFADRPLKQSAQKLLFGRAMGFAPYGDYWRKLRRIASTSLFCPKQIAAQEPLRQLETRKMIEAIARHAAAAADDTVQLRGFLQQASLNSIMATVFGRSYNDEDAAEAAELREMVREGFELLGAFNWADHLPALHAVDPHRVHERCEKLVPRVSAFVQKVIDEHRRRRQQKHDFVDVLLSLDDDNKLEDADMIAVLWEMIFRGTDTVALLTEWVMAEVLLHPELQKKLQEELQAVVPTTATAVKTVTDAEVSKLPLLQAVVKETLRLHPPGPLLSWARLAVNDVNLAGHHIPAGTTAMVNMWSITHDASVWPDPHEFRPHRFLSEPVDVKGTDLRLAPFGAGRRVCPGRALGLTTVHLWVATLLLNFHWHEDAASPVDLTEVLKLSSEMVSPLRARPIPRFVAAHDHQSP